MFATQFDLTQEQGPRSLRAFVWTVFANYRTDAALEALFRELDKCLQRAMNAEDVLHERLQLVAKNGIETIGQYFADDCYSTRGGLLPPAQSLLQNVEELAQGNDWPGIALIRQTDGINGPRRMPSLHTLISATSATQARVHDLAVDLVADALHRALLERYIIFRSDITERVPDKASFQVRHSNLFVFSKTSPSPISIHVAKDILDEQKDEVGSLETRANRLNKWIDLAEACRRRGAFAGFIAVCQALFDQPILRLESLWERTRPDTVQIIANWKSLMAEHQPNHLLFHSPIWPSNTEANDASACSSEHIVPFFGSSLPTHALIPQTPVRLSDWNQVTVEMLDHRVTRLSDLEVGQSEPVRALVNRLCSEVTDAHSSPAHLIELSNKIVPPHLVQSTERVWSKGQTPNRTALQPLIFVTPLPLDTLFAEDMGDDSQDSSTAMKSIPENVSRMNLTTRPSIRSRRTSLSGRRSSVSETSLSKGSELEAPSRHENLGATIRRIRGQLKNATIQIGEDIELQLVETIDAGARNPRHSLGSEITLSRRTSRARSSMALKRHSTVSVSDGRLQVTVKSASTERLVDILICGIEGDSMSVDDNGQVPLNLLSARKFTMDLEQYRHVFFSTFRSFLEPSILFEVSHAARFMCMIVSLLRLTRIHTILDMCMADLIVYGST